MTREQTVLETWDTVMDMMADPEADASPAVKMLLVDRVVAQIQLGELDAGLSRIDKAVSERAAVPNKCFLGDSNWKRKRMPIPLIIAGIQDGHFDSGLKQILRASLKRSKMLKTQTKSEATLPV